MDVEGLSAGDYLLGNGIVVERKTVADLHLSLERGRFWRQIGQLRRSARLPYLLIEGGDLDAGSLEPAAIRGVVLGVMGQGVRVIRSADACDSALWLSLLARRGADAPLGRDRPVYAQRLKAPVDEVPEAMLAAVPGISTHGARALLARFGTVAGVISAGYEAWLTVPGIGASKASALRRALS